MEIRRAKDDDVERINELLYQVAQIHAAGRPDLFKSASKKYTDEELMNIIRDEAAPIFVACEEGKVVGYAFCIYQSTENSGLLQDKRTLYIDDICVDERARGRGVGRALYNYVLAFARGQGFDEITLNVWAFNETALDFYEKMGMQKRKIVMEQRLK